MEKLKLNHVSAQRVPKVLCPDQALNINFKTSGMKILMHFLEDSEQQIKHGFTNTIQKTKHDQNDSYQEMELSWSVKSRGPGSSSGGCSRHGAYWWSERSLTDSSHLRKLAKALAGDQVGRFHQRAFLTTILPVPLI